MLEQPLKILKQRGISNKPTVEVQWTPKCFQRETTGIKKHLKTKKPGQATEKYMMNWMKVRIYQALKPVLPKRM